MKKLLLIMALIISGMGLYAQNYNVIDHDLQEVLNQKNDEMIEINIILKSQIDNEKLNAKINNIKDKSDRKEYVLKELKDFSLKAQKDLMSVIQGEEKSNKIHNIKQHWMVNMVTCTATPDAIYKLSEVPGIYAIAHNKMEKLIEDYKPMPAEPQRGMTENITKVNANGVWDAGYTGKNVIVAVLDSGVNTEHVDLADHLWDGGEEYPDHGWNFVNNTSNTHDGNGHGTHCSGTICGDGTSGTQTGMAPDATLMCIKVLNDNGRGTLNAFVSGVEFAAENGADILSISLGWENPDVSTNTSMRIIFENLLTTGIVAAVAAGNEGNSYSAPQNVRAPGNCPPPWLHPDQEANAGGLSAVISIGAVNYNDVPASFTSQGPVTWQNTEWNDYPYQEEINDTVIMDGNWMYYDDGVNQNGIGGPESFYWGVMFPSSALQQNDGELLTKLSFYDRVPDNPQVLVYTGGDTAPETLIHTESFTLNGTGSFVELDLSNPLTIDKDANLWIVMFTNNGTVFPASVSADIGNPNGRWISLDGSTWQDLRNHGLNYTWMLRAYLSDENTNEVSELKPITDYKYVSSTGNFSTSERSDNTKNSDQLFGLIRPDISAPGVNIVSASNTDNNGFVTLSGTSMATPCAAGVMALLLERNHNLTPAEVCRILEMTATPLEDKKSNLTGSGRINALTAIEQAEAFDMPHIRLQSFSPDNIVAGDNVEISVTLLNDGNEATSDNSAVKLSNNDPYINIIDDELILGILNPAETKTLTFNLDIENNIPHGYNANFKIETISNLEGNELKWSSNFNVTIKSRPNIVLQSVNQDTIPAEEIIDIELTVLNDGVYSADNINLNLSCSNPWVTIVNGESFINSIDVNETKTVTFSVKADEIMQDYEVMDFTLTANDDDYLTNTLEYGFDDGYEGWTTINANDDNHTWYHSSEASNHGVLTADSHGGTGHMMSESYCNASWTSMSPDDYFVSPEKYQATANSKLTFWACSNDANYQAEHFGVAISTSSNTSASDFNTIAEWTIGSKNKSASTKDRGNSRGQTEWIQYEVDLSEYAGQEIWIAIRHFNCTDQFVLLVDDVTIHNINTYTYWENSFSLVCDNPSGDITINGLDPNYCWTGQEQTIYVSLTNIGRADASNIHLSLSSYDQYITVADNQGCLITALVPDDTISLPFTIMADTLTPHYHQAHLNVACEYHRKENISTSFNVDKTITVSNALLPPNNLTAEAIDEQSVALSWDRTAHNTGYHIYRNNQYIAYTNDPFYDDSGLNHNTIYRYTVTSVRNTEESNHSAYKYVRTKNVPYNVHAELTDNESSVGLSWQWEELLHNSVIDFESGEIGAEWNNNISDYPWVITETASAGAYAIKSTCEGVNSVSSAIEIYVDVPYDSYVSFYQKVSSEANYDKGKFYIDGIEMSSISGEIDWEYAIFNVTQGAHLYRWEYSKDVSVSSNSDAYFIDNIRLYEETTSNISDGYFNVYRTNDNNETIMVASGITDNYFYDTEWNNLENGAYKWGVSVFKSSEESNVMWIPRYLRKKSCHNSYSFLYDFENTSLDEWNISDADGDGYKWFIKNESGIDGSTAMCSNSYNNTDDCMTTVNSYSISDESVLSWYVKPTANLYATEHYAVVISTDDENFTNIYEETLSESSYEYRTLDLSDYDGQDVYIGFRHYQSYGGICIDDVEISCVSLNNYWNPDPSVYPDNMTVIANVLIDGEELNHGSSEIIFRLYDTYGDGWNGASLTVTSFDGTTSQTVTMNGGSSELHTLNINSHCRVSFNRGQYDSECSFTIEYENGEIIYQSNGTPQAGYICDIMLKYISSNIELGAFCGDEVRGTSRAQYIESPINKNEFFLMIYGNANDEISFKLYDHKSDSILDLVTQERITFETNGMVGSMSNPKVINFTSRVPVTADVNATEAGTVLGSGYYHIGESVTLTAIANDGFSFRNWTTLSGEIISEENEFTFTVPGEVTYIANFNYIHERQLSKGWNWYSSFVNIDGTEGLAMMKDDMGSVGLQIKSQNDFISYEDGIWYGTLDELAKEEMYMLQLSRAKKLEMNGEKINPSECPISLNSNWNWITYPINLPMNVDLALSNLTPNDGDYVKSQTLFAQYYEGLGWFGTLNSMIPGEGYMYQNCSEEEMTLIYPGTNSKEEIIANITSEKNHWIPDMTKFPTNMTIIATVDHGEYDNSNEFEIGVFVGNECRGSARPIYIEELDEYMIFMAVCGENEEIISFRYYDLNGKKTYTIGDNIIFGTNATIGSLREPYIINFSTTNIDDYSTNETNIYPNPADRNVEIYLGTECDKVEIYNSLGVKVYEYENVDHIDGIETSGVYMIKTINDGIIKYERVVVK